MILKHYQIMYIIYYYLYGLAIAIIIGLVLGIQFMMGSVEQKAKVKDSLVPYVVGCIVIFGAFGIWKIVLTVLEGV